MFVISAKRTSTPPPEPAEVLPLMVQSSRMSVPHPPPRKMPPPSASEMLFTIAECAMNRDAPVPSLAIPPPFRALRLPSISALRTVSDVDAWPTARSQPEAGRQVATTPPARKPVTRARRTVRAPFATQTPDSVTPGSCVSVTSLSETSGRPSAIEMRQADDGSVGSTANAGAAAMVARPSTPSASASIVPPGRRTVFGTGYVAPGWRMMRVAPFGFAQSPAVAPSDADRTASRRSQRPSFIPVAVVPDGVSTTMPAVVPPPSV